jgi:hypothetical protein
LGIRYLPRSQGVSRILVIVAVVPE